MVVRGPDIAASSDPLVEALASVDSRARAMVRRFGLAPEDADDLIQQVALIYLTKRDEIHNPEPWLLGTLRNQCLSLVRKRYRDLSSRVDRILLEEMAEARKGRESTAGLRWDLERALGQLDERCREILQQRYLEDEKPIEIAETMGYRSSGIYKIVERCRMALTRRLLKMGFPGEAP